MQHHAAYGLTYEDLDVFIIEDSKPMQVMIRSIMASLHPHRIRTFDRADVALEAMLSEPPNLIISDWRMKPMNGLQLLKTLRNQAMAPLCYVPVLIVTAHATREMAQKAFLAGAQQVLVKPISPSILIDRINLVLHDPRGMFTGGDSRISITGVGQALAEQENRMEMLQRARIFHEAAIKHVEAQNAVDHLLGTNEASLSELKPPEPSRAPLPRASTAKTEVVAKPVPTKTAAEKPAAPPPVAAQPASAKAELAPVRKPAPAQAATANAASVQKPAPIQPPVQKPVQAKDTKPANPAPATPAPVARPLQSSSPSLFRKDPRASFARVTHLGN